MERFLHDVLQHHPHHYQDNRWLAGTHLYPANLVVGYRTLTGALTDD